MNKPEAQQSVRSLRGLANPSSTSWTMLESSHWIYNAVSEKQGSVEDEMIIRDLAHETFQRRARLLLCKCRCPIKMQRPTTTIYEPSNRTIN